MSNISEKQLLANRANAQKSTGPKSEAGKDKVRRNACRHHLTGQVFTMSDEDHKIYNKFLQNFLDDFKPEGALETSLVQSVAHGYWRLNRAEAIEENIFAMQGDKNEHLIISANPQITNAFLQAKAFFENPNTFALLTLYEQRIHRKTHKDLNTLLDLRAARERERNRRPKLSEAIKELTMAAAASQGTRDASRVSSITYNQNGFEFSNASESPKQPATEPAEPAKTASEPLDSAAKSPESV